MNADNETQTGFTVRNFSHGTEAIYPTYSVAFRVFEGAALVGDLVTLVDRSDWVTVATSEAMGICEQCGTRTTERFCNACVGAEMAKVEEQA